MLDMDYYFIFNQYTNRTKMSRSFARHPANTNKVYSYLPVTQLNCDLSLNLTRMILEQGQRDEEDVDRDI